MKGLEIGTFTELGAGNSSGSNKLNSGAEGIQWGRREGDVDFHSSSEEAESRQF